MRITLTLSGYVAAGLHETARQTNQSILDVAIDALRRGLKQTTPPRERFRVTTRDMGTLRPGLGLNTTANLIDSTEDPLTRF